MDGHDDPVADRRAGMACDWRYRCAEGLSVAGLAGSGDLACVSSWGLNVIGMGVSSSQFNEINGLKGSHEADGGHFSISIHTGQHCRSRYSLIKFERQSWIGRDIDLTPAKSVSKGANCEETNPVLTILKPHIWRRATRRTIH